MKFSMTGQGKDDCFKEVTTKAGLTVIVFHLLGEVEHPHGLDSKETAEVAELQLRLRDSLLVQV